MHQFILDLPLSTVVEANAPKPPPTKKTTNVLFSAPAQKAASAASRVGRCRGGKTGGCATLLDVSRVGAVREVGDVSKAIAFTTCNALETSGSRCLHRSPRPLPEIRPAPHQRVNLEQATHRQRDGMRRWELIKQACPRALPDEALVEPLERYGQAQFAAMGKGDLAADSSLTENKLSPLKASANSPRRSRRKKQCTKR